MATSITSAIDTEKWETGIDATTTNVKEVKAFVDQRLSIYKENRQKGFDLWESFVDDFKTFTRDILDNLGKDRLKRIRDYLRKNSVYIQKEARKSITDSLLRAIHKPTPSKWPTDDPAPDELTPDEPTPNDLTPNDTALAQITQAIDQLTLQGNFRREITYLTRLYTDEVKYSSKQDNFDFKFKIFQNYCLRVGVPKQAYTITILTMLRRLTLKYYFTYLKDLTLLENIYIGLKLYFEGNEYKRNILSKWNTITLKQVST